MAFLRGLVARGLSGVRLVISDAHSGLVAAIGAALPGASWQRCRTHYAVNLMSVTPKSSWPWERTMLHSIYDQVDAKAVAAQFDRVIDTLAEKLPPVADHLDQARADPLALTRSPRKSGDRSGPIIRRNDSTRRSAAGPMSWASSPTVAP